MTGQSPVVTLLLAMQSLGQAGDYSQTGVAGDVTVRFSRNRKPVRSQKPCITLVFVGDDEQPTDLARNEWEQVRELAVDAQADLDLDTEDSEIDPTGIDKLLKFLDAFVNALKDPVYPTFLGGLCDWITVSALEPDERSTPDDGRMTRALKVVYRVRSDDANVLLAAGVNG